MTIKPILFNTLMVQAHDAGRKTQTRRDAGLKYINLTPNEYDVEMSTPDTLFFRSKDGQCMGEIKSPFGGPGDILWRRETYQLTTWLHQSDENYGYIYLGTENGKEWEANDDEFRWRPSIHMPKQACRKWMKILELYPQRLQHISEADAIAEGIQHLGNGIYQDYLNPDTGAIMGGGPLYSFQTLFQSINGPEVWDANPWVWRISYEDCPMPEGFLPLTRYEQDKQEYVNTVTN